MATLTPLQAYRARVMQAQLQPDPTQEAVAAKLDALAQALRKKRGKPRGMYIWGAVGRGKSMLMDLFFEAAEVEQKRRVHFQAFMQETHAAIHRIRQDKSGDPVMVWAAEVARGVRLLCFDELQANDVADATLLFRLFEALLQAGVVIVTTSNRPPEEIYQGGVQAERFAKFIALLNGQLEVLALDSPHDYRRRESVAGEGRYVWPLGARADAFAAGLMQGAPERVELEVQGRTLALASYGGMAAAHFAELCEVPLGAADYLAIAARFDALLLIDIPVLTPESRNAARRFTALVDALYEAKTLFYATAAAPPDALYAEGDGSFEFRRTASRLVEMGSWDC